MHSRTPIVVFFELCTKQIMNLQCGASVFQKAVTLCADVACLDVGMADERPDRIRSRPEYIDPLLSETMAAKEAKEADRLWWKTPRLFKWRQKRDCSAD